MTAARIRNLAADLTQALCDFNDSLPAGFTLETSTAERERMVAAWERFGINGAEMISAIRGAMTRTGLRLSWTSRADRVTLSVIAYRMNGEGLPTGAAKIGNLITVSRANALAVLAAL